MKIFYKKKFKCYRDFDDYITKSKEKTKKYSIIPIINDMFVIKKNFSSPN